MNELMAAVQSWIASAGVETLFLTVFILGIVATLPIGPWSMVALDQTHKYGNKHGLCIATSAIVGDMISIVVTLVFYTAIQHAVHAYQNVIYVILSLLMVLFGFYFLLKKKEKSKSFKLDVIKILGKFKVEKPLAEKLYNRLGSSHKFTYLFTVMWSAFHPGNLMTYATLSLMVTALGYNLTEGIILAEYLIALLIATAFMWYSWILLGQLKIVKRTTFVIVKCFGAMFLVAGLVTFYLKVIPSFA
ncbi:MAG: hypothetical protein CMF61_00690 [Magnetococcales bacterium]|nr:hypothetical protein [Magnetococcales bacterium]